MIKLNHNIYTVHSFYKLISGFSTLNYIFFFFIKLLNQGTWEQKIKHRMKRSSARRSLLKNVSGCDKTPTSSKKAKKQSEEMWYSIPEMPDRETEEKMEEKVKQLKKAYRSSRPDQSVIQGLMLETYPLRY